MRATASVFPPAANGAISLIGRFCHLPRARARAAQTRMAAERGCFILSHVETARSKDRKRGRIRTAIVMLRVGFATHTPYSASVRNRGIDHVQFRRPRHAIPFGARADGGARTA